LPHGQLQTEGGGAAEHPEGSERGAQEADGRAPPAEDAHGAREASEQGETATARLIVPWNALTSEAEW